MDDYGLLVFGIEFYNLRAKAKSEKIEDLPLLSRTDKRYDDSLNNFRPKNHKRGFEVLKGGCVK